MSRDVTSPMTFAPPAADVARLPPLARELVAGRPDVIVSATAHGGARPDRGDARHPDRAGADRRPGGLGLTDSMARPTANVTGFTTGHDTVAVKRLELLLELVPAARKVAFLWVPGQCAAPAHRRAHAGGGRRAQGRAAVPSGRRRRGLSLAIARAESGARGRPLIAPDPLIVRNRQTIIDECLLRDLPAMHSYSFEVRDGALMSYGSDVGEDYGARRRLCRPPPERRQDRRSAVPGADHFHLSINLRTARTMKLTVPQSLLVRADQVID